MKRVFIIHGWDSSPEEGWLPWLKDKLKAQGVAVTVPTMPDPRHPNFLTWVPRLAEVVGQPNEKTFFVGHSAGCQTILRYLTTLDDSTRVGGVALVAPWTHLIIDDSWTEEDKQTAKPWLTEPIDWEKAKRVGRSFISIFSDDDGVVALTEKDIFGPKLGSSIVIEHGKKHFSGEEGVNELPSALQALDNLENLF